MPTVPGPLARASPAPFLMPEGLMPPFPGRWHDRRRLPDVAGLADPSRPAGAIPRTLPMPEPAQQTGRAGRKASWCDSRKRSHFRAKPPATGYPKDRMVCESPSTVCVDPMAASAFTPAKGKSQFIQIALRRPLWLADHLLSIRGRTHVYRRGIARHHQNRRVVGAGANKIHLPLAGVACLPFSQA